MPVPLPIRGRGASWNPPNRFETIYLEPDDWVDPDDPEPAPPETQILRDSTREILSQNDSPDLSFEHGINVYRGCSHGCVYCLSPRTPVLHADLVWRPLGEIREGDELVSVDEYPTLGSHRSETKHGVASTGTRKLRKAVVEAVWWSSKPTRRLVTEHAEVLTTSDHRWLQDRGFRWSRTEQLWAGRRLRHLSVDADEPEDHDYRVGYLTGVTLGYGTFRYEPGQRSDKLGFAPAYWRVAMTDVEPLERLICHGRIAGIDLALRDFDPGPKNRGHARMFEVETRALDNLARIHAMLTTELRSRSYRRGFLAGFFDAEGSNGGSLRLSQVDCSVLERVGRYAASLGFRTQLEPRPGKASTLRLVGSIADRIRFFSIVRPAIRRKIDRIFGYMPPTDPERVMAIESGPTIDVVDIQTSTGTFFAAGLATHNCFARPYHEYLGFSAGLDFETKIVVKEDAPALLRKRLSQPKWKPQTLMMSGATDPYQPLERRMKLTRGVLEVLAEFRNPVAVITKNHLITRDVDLLVELARFDAVSCILSITTLRNELQRIMEPRTSIPQRRLDAIRTLAQAGVPVGVNVAPVIPGLTDEEMPAILEAAAAAGAKFASFVVVRLPHAVAPLFETWLAQHFPDRKDKVLNRLRDLHGGRLYDSTWGHRGRGAGAYAEQIEQVFRITSQKAGLNRESEKRALSTAAFRVPGSAEQLALL
jgi:DNA repair photolyase